MSLISLSDEILLEILELLWEDYHRNEALLSITQCSKRLHNIATPLIYKEFNEYAISTWNTETLLLRTLLENPQIGNFCKSFTSCRVDGSSPDRTMHPDEIALCKERIGIFCSTANEVDKWLIDLKNQVWESSASLLLSCMPNVEKFCFDHWTESASNSFNRVLEHAAALQAQGSESTFALSRLTFIHANQFETWVTLESLTPFLTLRSLKTAEFEYTVGDSNPPVDTPTFDLNTLVLGTAIDGEWSRLDGFLSKFKNLKSFRLIEDDFERDPYHESEPYEMDGAISGLKHSLENLEIVQYPRHYEDTPWISSLADFQQLRKISLDSSSVNFKPSHRPRSREVDVLPKSLETLELINYDLYTLELLLRILQNRDELLPKLVNVKLEKLVAGIDDSDEDGDEDTSWTARYEKTRGSLEELCEDAAIKLKFLK